MKLCHMIESWFSFIIQVPKFGRPSPKNGAKNVINSVRFRTTSDFDREYLRKEWRYRKSERHAIDNDSSRVRRKKSGELRSTNNKVEDVSLDSQKSTFWKTIFRPLGGAAPLEFLVTISMAIISACLKHAVFVVLMILY